MNKVFIMGRELNFNDCVYDETDIDLCGIITSMTNIMSNSGFIIYDNNKSVKRMSDIYDMIGVSRSKFYRIAKCFFDKYEVIRKVNDGGVVKFVVNPNIVFVGKAPSKSQKKYFKEQFAEDGYVYIFEKDDKIKIGITKNVKRRIRNFETHGGIEITKYYYFKHHYYKDEEKRLHKIFDRNRTIGEYFKGLSIDDVLREVDCSYGKLRCIENRKGLAIKKVD